MIALAILFILPLGLALAALTDLFTMTIPNRIPAVLLASFLILAPLSGLPWPDIGMSLVAALIVFAACFGLFAVNVMGGGDAKLLTAAAAWFGFNQSLILFLVAVSLIGGLLTIAVLMIRSQSSSVLAMGIPLPASLTTAKKIPYGIAIAIAGFVTYDQSPIFRLATGA
ncbi:prepilin peptidase [Rhizobium sp. LCM 4573]|uniref:A24 family peptidase n=1 Tax=Rhizobium sp. LCM 4573 TaxID=1848291 RepID=UPI0008DAC5AB|nr:prepilin peptidase [Rhizobium sp. LCM 4573]OHV79042.1 peptidase [Rhizobium sp. LCM 4573]